MRFALLGPLEIRTTDGSEVVVGAPKLRALAIDLLLEPGRVLSFDRLVEDVWDGDAPAHPLVSLRSYVSNLRRLLVDDDGRPLVITRGRGYLLDVDATDVDATVFEDALVAARRALDEDAEVAVERLDEALAMWRGPALVDVADLAFARAHAVRLEQLRSTAVEDRLEALLRAGRPGEVVAEAEAHVAREPLRERPRALLMLGLHRIGRGPDALAVHRDLRARLAEELGLDPSPSIERLAARILRQDPSLEGPTQGPDRNHHAPVAGLASRPDDGRRSAIGRSASSTRLVGRDEPLQVLDGKLSDLGEGAGGLVVVSGEPGIGKTALLEELARRASSRGVPSAWGRCEETAGAPPLWPWTQALETLADGLDDDGLGAALAGRASGVTRLAPSLTERTGITFDAAAEDPQAARFALYGAVAVFLDRLAGGTGLVVVVDDLHWGDSASCELTSFLAGRVTPARVLLAVSHRDAPVDVTPALRTALAGLSRQSGVVRLPLGPLDDDEVARVARQVGTDPSEDDLRQIRARADGNPFHARQLARLLAEAPDSGPPTAVPSGIRQVVVHRLATLPSGVRQVLDVGAVLGQEMDVRVLAASRGWTVGEVLDHLDVARAHGLVEGAADPTSAPRFVHALVRDTLLAELAPGRRARLHAAIADALEVHAPATAAVAAQHLYDAAELIGPDRPVRALRAAAERAAEVFAYAEAEESLRRALALLERSPVARDEQVELAVRLRLIQIVTGLYGWTSPAIEEVASPVRRLAVTSGIAAEAVPMWWSLWACYMTRGDLDVAVGLAQELLDAASTTRDPVARVAGHVSVAYSRLFAAAPHAEVLDHLTRAREAEQHATGEQLGLAAEHLSVAIRVSEVMAHALHGRSTAALAAADEALATAEALGQPFQIAYARMFAGLGAAVLDLPAAADTHGSAGLATCERAGLGYLALLTTAVHAWARARLGGDAAAEAERIAAATSALETAGQLHVQPCWQLLLAEARLLAGDHEGALAALDEADRFAATTGEQVHGAQRERVLRRADSTVPAA